jgi:hypothetical protein
MLATRKRLQRSRANKLSSEENYDLEFFTTYSSESKLHQRGFINLRNLLLGPVCSRSSLVHSILKGTSDARCTGKNGAVSTGCAEEGSGRTEHGEWSCLTMISEETANRKVSRVYL